MILWLIAPLITALAGIAVIHPLLQKNRSRSSSYAAMAVALILPLLTLTIYMAVGSPDIPDFPRAASVREDATLSKLTESLRNTPSDIENWKTLGRMYMDLDRFPQAVAVYRHLLTLEGRAAPSLVNLAEALIAAHGGAIDEPAATLLEEAVQLDPRHILGHHLLALSKAQKKEYPAALKIWLTLRHQVRPDDPLRSEIETYIKAVETVPRR